MSLFWSSGGSILTQIKNAGRKIKMTPRKIQSPVFSLPVDHRHPRSSAYRVTDMNVLGLKFMFLCTFLSTFLT